MKKVSVIIPTYNGAHYLKKLMPLLSEQSIAFELIIVDSSSSDETIEVVEPYASCLIQIDKTSFDHGGTRRMAAQRATGEYLIFMTQDAVPCDRDTLKKLLEPLDRPNIAAVFGRQLPHDGASFHAKHLRFFNYPPHSYVRSLKDRRVFGLKTTFFSDSFAAYQKRALQEIGWFEERILVGEDMVAAAKLLLHGYHIAYQANAAVFHSHEYTVWEEFRRYFDIGVFHSQEAWLIEKFGRAEGEGVRYVLSEWRYLMEQRAWGPFLQTFVRHGAKWLGYRIGRHYDLLPFEIRRYFSLHRSWWQKP